MKALGVCLDVGFLVLVPAVLFLRRLIVLLGGRILLLRVVLVEALGVRRRLGFIRNPADRRVQRNSTQLRRSQRGR